MHVIVFCSPPAIYARRVKILAAAGVIFSLLFAIDGSNIGNLVRRVVMSGVATLGGGRPATVLRKVTHVEAYAETGQLPVHTVTFSRPSSLDGLRIDHGDVVKVVIPDFKPKSYSMSAEREGEFDITFKVYPNGRCSGYLDRLQVGDEVSVFKRGSKSRNPGSHVGLVAFGVGITEILP